MNFEVKIANDELNIVKSIEYFRLWIERELITRDLNDAKSKIVYNTEWYNFIKNTSNAYNEAVIKEKKSQLEAINKAILEFEKNNSDANYKMCFDDDFDDYINEFYHDDKYWTQRCMLGISIIINTNRKFNYEKEEFEEISKMIFHNTSTMSNIKKLLESNYSNVAKKELSTTQKFVLGGVAATAIVLAVTAPVLMAGGIAAAASTTTHLLCLIGLGDMQLGIGMVALLGLITGSAVLGTTYGIIKNKNKEDAKKAFRNLNFEQSVLYLAVALTLINNAKYNMPANEFNNYVKEVLETKCTLQNDIEYVLFINNENINTNKDKLVAFNNFNKVLMKTLNI